MQMYIQWNEAKRRKNLRKHGVDFALLGGFFDGELMTHEDLRFAYAERRFESTGMLEGVVHIVVWAPTDEGVHLISARKANRNETKAWFEIYGTRH
jgi:uncharacterized protein